MKKILFTSLAVLGLGITGCSNEDLGVAKSGVDEVCATMGDAESRTAMNSNSVVWSIGDEIGIFVTNGSSSTYTNINYSLSSGAGTKNAGFSGVLEGESPVKKAAFYPYGSDASYDGSKISLTLKDTYNYKEGENSSALMACQINESAQDVLAFKNAGALMSITVNNIPKDYTWAKLTSMTAQEKTTVPAIAGNAQIAFADGIPTLTTTETSNSSSITINFTAGNDVTSKTFYFPLPVAEYPALELSIGNGATSQVLKTKALDAKRNERYTTTITLDEVSGSVPTTVESVSEVADALKETNSVSVADVASTETSPTVSIPKKSTPAENVSISFENISTTNAVAIKEESTGTGGTAAPENVLVSVPQLDTAPKFEIDLPSSTVTLAANGETATYDEVTATTAANTLVLGKGVTVNTLKVKAGNVRVKSGAKVTAISRESSNTSTVIIYKEEGAELPNLSGNDAFEVVDAAVADLQNVAKNGTHREPGILVDGSRGGAVRRNHHSQLILLQNGADIIALIMRCCILLTREHPDLEEIQLLFTAIIELAMENPRTYTHHLDIARSNHFAVPDTVAVTQISFQRNRDDFHILMWMCIEALSRSDRVVIQDPKHAKMYSLRVVVIGKTKSVMGLQPSMICIPASIGFIHYCFHK